MEGRLEQIIRETVEIENLSIVDLQIKGRAPSKSIMIYITSDSGVSVTDCAKVSRHLWDRLENEEVAIFDSIGRIDVSSPGTDRPLKTQDDFARNIGRCVHVHFKVEDRTQSVKGTIERVNASGVTLMTSQGETLISYDSVEKAEIQLQWNR